MKLRSVTKLDKRNTATSKKFDDDVIFQFMVHLYPCGSPTPDAWSIKLPFSLTITFYLTKTERRTKKSLTQLSYYWFE